MYFFETTVNGYTQFTGAPVENCRRINSGIIFYISLQVGQLLYTD
ncbi:hypothetical protein ABIE50_003692 [Chitinophaga sp. OAE865]